MKTILIILNLLLAGAVLWSGARFVQGISGEPKPAAFTVKKRVPKTQKATASIQNTSVRRASIPEAGEKQVKEIVELDVFNQDRCPNAGVWGGGNARVEMTLVGTFRIGQTQGAVILQKSQARNFPFMQFGGGMMNNQGGMQRRQGIGRGGPGGGFGGGPGGFGGGFNGGQGGQGGRPGGFNGGQGGGDSGRRSIGGSRFISANRDARGVVQPGQQNNNTNVTYKQYVRLGETMANGYRLTEINRNSVVLVRGSDRVELELVDASVNAKQNARRNNNAARPANQTQVMQQMLQSMQNMQRAQMMQNFQMMRMQQQNQQNQQNQQQSRGGTAPRRR